MDLKVVLNSIIPDNIKRIPLIEKSVNVFSEMLLNNSIISYRINKIFDVDSTEWTTKDELGNIVVLDPEESSQYKYISDAKNNLKQGLFYTYLSVMFGLLGALYKDPDVIRTIGLRSLKDSNLLKEPYNTISSEYLGAFRYFQTSSGTEQAIRCMYQFARYLETGYIDNSLELESGAPFFLQYRGELHKSIFKTFNMPMSHPCGWCFLYDTIVKLVLEDYYGIKFTYNVKTIELRIRNTRIFFGELPRGISTTNVVRERAIETIEEKLAFPAVHVISDRTPHSSGQSLNVVNLEIQDILIEDKNVLFVFDSGNALYIDRTGKKAVVKFGPRDSIFSDDVYIFPKTTIYIPVDLSKSTWEFEYKDVFLMEETIEPSGGTSAIYYNDDFNNAFKLVGDSYPFCPGVDEARHKITNNTNVLDKFTCTVDYTSNNITYLRVEDDFGHNTTLVRDLRLSKEANWKFSTCTHGFYGEYLTFKAYDGKSYNYDHYIRTNLLNRFNSKLSISGFSLENKKIKFRAETTETTHLTITTKIGSRTFEERSGPIKNYELDTSAFTTYSEFKVTITDWNDTITIEGSGLNSTNFTFNFSFPTYPSSTIVKPKFSNCTPDTMETVPSGTKLSKLNKTPAEKWKNNTVQEDVYITYPDEQILVDDLTPKNHSGIVYINRGYSTVKTPSIDTFNVSSTKYMSDDFFVETSGNSNWIQFANPVRDGSLGKYLVCRFNSDPQTDIIRGMLRGYVLVFK